MKRALASIAFLLASGSGAAWAQQTVLWFQSDAGDYIGAGQTNTYLSPAYQFSVTRNGAQGVSVSVAGWNLDLASATNDPLEPGAYESAARFAFKGTAAGLEFTGDGRGCNTITGRFVVHEVAFDGIGVVQSLAADFEQHCEGGTPALWGEIRVNSSVPLTINKGFFGTTPDPMAFLSQAFVPPSILVTSNSSTVYGITAALSISVIGGTYSVNGGPFVSSPGTVHNRDHVRVQLTSSPVGSATTSAVLSVGEMGAPITALYFKSYSGDYIGAGKTLYAPSSEWSITFQRSSPDQVQVNVDGAGSGWWTLNLASSLGAPLEVGAYEEAARAAFRGSSPGLDFEGSGRGCNTIIGRFSVLEADYNTPGFPRFAADFEQWCQGSTAPLLGEVRINSSVPLNFLVTDPDSMPDPMALWAQSPVKAGSIVYSNWTRVYGINVGVPISISGPASFSLNAGDFGSSPRTAYNLDLVEVSMTAPMTPGTTAQSTLNVGGRSIPFSVTTYQPGQSLTGLYFRSSPGEYVGQGETKIYLAPYNRFSILSYENGFQLSVNGLGGDLWQLIMTPPSGSTLTPGVYEGAVGVGWGSPSLDFFGNGNACGHGTGRFVVHEAVYNADGSIARFSADFEERCQVDGPALYGEFRYNATTPFSFLNAAFMSAASRKAHGGAGSFDLALTPAAIDGPITIEPRVIGGGHTIVFRFDSPIWNPGTASCVDAFGSSIGTISLVTASGNEVTVNLTGIVDNQRTTVALANVNGSGISASASLGFLVGDVNATKTVTAADILRIKGRQGPIDSSTFTYDLDLSGGVSPGDLLVAKQRSGLSLP